MSRSIVTKHNKKGIKAKIYGGDSDKKDKQSANRSFRRSNKMDAKESTLEGEDRFKYHDIREVSDTWDFRSDGLSYYLDISNYDEKEYAKLKSK